MFELLAAAGSTAPDVTNEMTEGLVGFFVFMLCGFLVVFLVVAIIMLWLIYNAAQAADPKHQRMNPGLVWLLLIPLFNLFWMFKVYPAVSDSLAATARDRGQDVGDAGRGIGLAYCIVALISVLVTSFVNYDTQPSAGFASEDGWSSALSLVSLVLLIIYVVKVQGVKKIIKSSGK